jgi:hypothetical protein
MRRIYSQACEVMVYLGEAEHEWGHVFDLIYLMSQFQDDLNMCQSAEELGDDEYRRWASIPSRAHPLWEQFFKMSLSPWFMRTWIIQEVVLAQKVTLFYGKFPMPWEVFVKAYQLYTRLTTTRGQMHIVREDPLKAWNTLGMGRLINLCHLAQPHVEG